MNVRFESAIGCSKALDLVISCTLFLANLIVLEKVEVILTAGVSAITDPTWARR